MTCSGETRNLARDPVHDDRMRAMMQRVWKFGAETNDTCVNPYILVRFPRCGPATAFGDIYSATGGNS
jgi:hypothetical protein